MRTLVVLTVLSLTALAAIGPLWPYVGHEEPHAVRRNGGSGPGVRRFVAWPAMTLTPVLLIGGFVGAIAWARGATPDTPPTATALAAPHLIRAELALRDGALPRASRELRIVLALDPSDARARTEMGLVLFLSGRPRAGLISVHRALIQEPGDPRAALVEGLILLRGLHRPHAALDPLRLASRQASSRSDQALVRRLLADARSA